MALAHDATTNSTAATGDLSWTHTPVAAVVKGVIVRIAQNTNAVDQIDGVTYGGVPMVECPGSPLLHTNGAEDGALYAYFLADPPPGARQVVVDTNSTGSTRRAVCVTVTADAGKSVRVEDFAVLDSAGVANPSVTVPTGASTPTMAFGVLHSGQDAVTSIAAAAGNTEQFEHDFGSQCASWIRTTTPDAGGGVTIGWTVASEEAGVLAVALREEAVSYPTAEEFVFSTPGLTTVSSISLAAPAARQVGDGLLAGLYIYDLATTVPDPAGWTLLQDTPSGSSHRMRTYWRKATGDASDTFAPSWTGAQLANAGMLRIANADHVDAIGADSAANSASGILAGVTTADANELLFAYINTDSASTITPPADLIQRGSANGVGFYTGPQAVAGASGNKTFGVSPSQHWAGHLISLSPLPASSGEVINGAASLNGSGGLAAAARRDRRSGASFAAAGSLAAQAKRQRAAAVTLAGTAGLTGTARRARRAGAALAGTSALSVAGRRVRAAAAALAGQGALTATPRRTRAGGASLAGAGGLHAAGSTSATIDGAAVLSGSGGLNAAAKRTRRLSATLAGQAGLAATARRRRRGSASLAGTGVLNADGGRVRNGGANLVGAGSLAATAKRSRRAGVALTGSSSLTVSPRRRRTGRAALAASGSIAASPNRIRLGAVALAGAGTLIARGVVHHGGELAYLVLVDQPAAHLLVTDRLRWTVTAVDRPATYLTLEDR